LTRRETGADIAQPPTYRVADTLADRRSESDPIITAQLRSVKHDGVIQVILPNLRAGITGHYPFRIPFARDRAVDARLSLATRSVL
jgi:hypothetical protein